MQSFLKANAIVSVHNISKSRGGKMLFQDVSFALHAGQVLGVHGESGCGKSTLGDMLLGLLSADAGSIHWSEQTESKKGGKRQVQKLFQDPSDVFASAVTLERSFADVLKKYGIPNARLMEWLEKLRLDRQLLQRYPHQVSGGELQRLAIARVMLLQPSFIFADEPTSRLDMLTQQTVIEALLEIVDEGSLALMLVSHDVALLNAVCDQVIEIATVEKVYSDYILA